MLIKKRMTRVKPQCLTSLVLLCVSTAGNALADEPPATDTTQPTPLSPAVPANEPQRSETSTPAPSQSPSPEPVGNTVNKTQPKSTWYGLPSVIGVGISHAMIAGGLFGVGLPLVIPGVLGAGFTTPIVHWAHGNVGRGFVSLGGNVVVPWIGALIAAKTGAKYDGGWGALFGAWAGFAVWNILDIAALHYETKETRSARIPSRYAPTFAIAPMIQPKTTGIAIVGQF